MSLLPGPREFALLLTNAYSWKQLYEYIWDAKQEYKLRNTSCDNRYYTCGHFFNRAYGLELTEKGEFNLGKYILTGQFKPDSLQCTVLTRSAFSEYRDKFERFWKQV